MNIGGGRSVFLVVIIGIIVQCVASDSPVCRVQERLNMGLSKILDPAEILSVGYESQSAPDCYHACCNFTENRCNAVSFYDKEKLCMLLNCHPFGNCVWVTADGFKAARIHMTAVADDAQPPPPPAPLNPASISDPMASSTTSQQPMGLTTSQALAELVTSTTTTTTTQATTATIVVPNTPGGSETSATQPVNPETSSNSAQASASFDTTNSSEVSDWNMNNEDNLSAEAAPNGLLPTVNPDSSEQTAAAPAIQGDYSIDNQTDDSVNNTVEANEPFMNTNNGSYSEEEWNVDSSVSFISDDGSRSGQAGETSTKGLTDDSKRSTAGASTEEPWNIDSSFFSNNVGQNDNGQPTDLNNGQIDNGQPADLNNGQTDNGQPADLNNGQTDNGQPADLNNGQTDNGQPTYNDNVNEPSFEDPWIVDSWLQPKTDDLSNTVQAMDSSINGSQDNGQTDNAKDDFTFTDGSLPQATNSNEFTTRSNAGDGKQPDDQQQQQHFEDMFGVHSIEEWESPILDAPAPSIPDSESRLVQPVFILDEGEGSNARPREMKRMLIQSPGIIIGLCSALGVAFLVLLAVCRKVYLSHDRPRYKQLRDYDIRFEPPAASSALLP